MNRKTLMVLAALAMATGSMPARAKEPRTYAVVNEAVGVPVFPNDVTDRPYTVVGEVTAHIRKATVFSNEASQVKIYRELWERADKMGADAVVKATYGNSHVTAMSWGSTTATGTAIKFTAPASTPAPAPQP